MTMPRVRFVPLGKEKEIRAGATILAAAIQCEVPLGQSCSGDGNCGWCRVSVVEGADNLAPPDTLEQRVMRDKEFKANERVACLARIQGDVTITTTYWGYE
jgi:ferredoxin